MRKPTSQDNFDARSARTRQPLPLWSGAFDRATHELGPEIIGAYLLILIAMWEAKSCDISTDERLLARVARVSPTIWRRKLAPIITPMLSEENGRFFSEKLKENAGKTEDFCTQQHAKKYGKIATKPLKNKEPEQTMDEPELNHGSSSENPKPITYNHIKEEEEGASARESLSIFEEVMLAVGIDPATPPKFWRGAPAKTHVLGWQLVHDLTDDELVEAARLSRSDHPEPPDGPKALDRYVAAYAKAKASAGAVKANPAKPDRYAPVPTSHTATDRGAVMHFWAESLNAGRFVSPSSIKPDLARAMIEAQLVTQETLKSKGIAF
jgi:uncharacterized protein YdaU (DUF1376 family)